MLCLCAAAQVKPTPSASGRDIFRNMDAPSHWYPSGAYLQFRTSNGRILRKWTGHAAEYMFMGQCKNLHFNALGEER